MATNQTRAVSLSRAVEASITGDVSSIEELFTRDVTGSTPALTVSSREELAIELEERDDAFSELEVALNPLDVIGDQACVEWIASAVHSGPYPLGDHDGAVLEPTGRRLELRGISVAEFEGDQISVFRHYWDEMALLAQLGCLPDD
jgi:ketosteroid isomerase-like protein